LGGRRIPAAGLSVGGLLVPGLGAPPDYQWVRYGPDLLLVDLTTGEVIDVVYDVFY
jgi:hypothetical protein